jgi:two-component system NtrC family response regulator
MASIPPLRERKEDIRALCRATLQRLGRAEVEMDFHFLTGLLHHTFPGDVDELEQILDESLARCEGPMLGAAHLPLPLRERMALLYSSRG